VAVLLMNGASTNNITSVTDSLGSHLAYSKLVALAAVQTDTEIWAANCASAQTNMTVTVNLSGVVNINDCGLAIVVFTGAATTQNGATQSSSSSNADPSANLTTTANNSWVIGAVTNWSNTTLPTIPGGQTDVFNSLTLAFQNSTTGTSGWAQAQTTTTASSGSSVTINDSAPTIQYSMVIAEILAGSGSPTATVAWLS